jgi:hypothetical protein
VVVSMWQLISQFNWEEFATSFEAAFSLHIKTVMFVRRQICSYSDICCWHVRCIKTQDKNFAFITAKNGRYTFTPNPNPKAQIPVEWYSPQDLITKAVSSVTILMIFLASTNYWYELWNKSLISVSFSVHNWPLCWAVKNKAYLSSCSEENHRAWLP